MKLRRLIEDALSDNSAHVYDASLTPVTGAALLRRVAAIEASIVHRARAPVGILLPQGHDYFLTILACMHAGIHFVPMSLRWPQARREQVIQLGGIQTVVTTDVLDRTPAGEPASLLPGSGDLRHASQPLYTIFTSGTTGAPKGVTISRGAFETFVHFMHELVPDIGADTRQLGTFDFSFDGSLIDLALFLRAHGHIAFFGADQNMFALASLIQRFGATLLMTVPSTASLLLNGFLLRKFSYRTLTHLLLGGARFSAGLYERILANLHPDLALFNLYGPTECAVASHGTRLTRDPKSDIVDGNVTIGRPGPSVECRLMASNREEPTVRRSGELLLGGPQLMNGYLNDPERTAEVIQDVGGCHFYRTGDAAYVDGAGNYYISGRLDETVKRSGYRINLQDIDSYVSRLPCVELCAAVAVDTDELDLRIVMFIVPTSTSVTVTELQRSMRVCLADSQMPDEIIMLSTLPRNVSGKIDRAAILASYARQHARVDAELVRTDSLESA